MTTDQFERLCALLPHRASWGDSLTPAIVQGICEAISSQPQAEPDDSGCLACVMCGAPAAPVPAQCAQAAEVDMLPGECWISLEAQALRARGAPAAPVPPMVPLTDEQLFAIYQKWNLDPGVRTMIELLQRVQRAVLGSQP